MSCHELITNLCFNHIKTYLHMQGMVAHKWIRTASIDMNPCYPIKCFWRKLPIDFDWHTFLSIAQTCLFRWMKAINFFLHGLYKNSLQEVSGENAYLFWSTDTYWAVRHIIHQFFFIVKVMLRLSSLSDGIRSPVPLRAIFQAQSGRYLSRTTHFKYLFLLFLS